MPRNGLPALPHASSSASIMPGMLHEPLAAIGEGADAGQHDALGRAHLLGSAVTLTFER